MQTLHLKHMVCNRCIRVVLEEAQRVGLQVVDIRLGEIDIPDGQSPIILEAFQKQLLEAGFEPIRDRRAQIVERVKLLVLKSVYQEQIELSKLNFSDYLARELNLDYNYISRVFSENENITLEKYIIYQKIERIKELIVYEEMTFSEIAFKLGYSSPQHLSNQFKSVTGLTPSAFRQSNAGRRKPLDRVA